MRVQQTPSLCHTTCTSETHVVLSLLCFGLSSRLFADSHVEFTGGLKGRDAAERVTQALPTSSREGPQLGFSIKGLKKDADVQSAPHAE